MTQSKLFILGQEIELLWTDMNYHREIRRNGKPATEIMGGLITICFETREKTDMVLRWMTKESEDDTWNEVDKMEKGNVCFYENGFDYPPTKTYEFNDAHLIYFKESFYSDGKEPMQTVITISPAIQNYGTDFIKPWNENWIPPSERTPYQPAENNDKFYLSIKHLANKKTFVPIGVPAYSGTAENKNIEFEIEITENGIDDFQVEFLHDNKVIQTYYSGRQTLDGVVITAKGSGNNSSSNTSNNQNTQSNYPKGKYNVKWDGFDSNRIYDSTIFTKGKLKARIKGKRNGKEKSAESSEFAFEYKEVNWVDTKIDKNAKRIDVTLRVNLEDGGENGTEKDCYETGSGSYAPITKHCPWDKIPKKNLTHGTPIKTRTKSFEDLEKLAIDGLNYHWGRNRNHFIAKNVDINGKKYELFVNSVNTTENAMDDVSLIFNTNNSWMRSGNPGTVEDPISFIGNIVSREAICYNIGYIKYSDGWGYRNEDDIISGIGENLEFMDTSAHEIGHTILKAYGGTFYSYGHKGSVNTVFQNQKSSAPKFPLEGEIDIMPYHKENELGKWYRQPNYYKRRVAHEKDVLSLIWLTKINLK